MPRRQLSKVERKMRQGAPKASPHNDGGCMTNVRGVRSSTCPLYPKPRVISRHARVAQRTMLQKDFYLRNDRDQIAKTAKVAVLSEDEIS